MPEVNGADVVLLVNTGTPATPVWEQVASQQDVTFDETTDYIETSSKDSRNRKGLPGRYSWSVSFDSLYIPGGSQYAALRDAMRNGVIIEIRRRESGTDVEKSGGVLTTLSNSFPDQGAATVAATIEGTEGWTVI